MKNIKKRLMNKGSLTAIGSQLVILAGIIYFYVTGEPMPATLVADLSLAGVAILVILTALGILNNPDTENKGLKDDEL